MTRNNSVRRALSRNFLSSTLALAFNTDLINNPTAQTDFLDKVHWLQKTLDDVQPFSNVEESKPWGKWLTKLITLLDAIDSSAENTLGCRMKIEILNFWVLIFRQLPSTAFESASITLLPRILQITKDKHVQDNLLSVSCTVMTVLVFRINEYTTDNRREFLDHIAKILPVICSRTIACSKQSNCVDGIKLWLSTVKLLTHILKFAPHMTKNLTARIETVCVEAPLSCKSPIEGDLIAASSACLASLANCSENNHEAWVQTICKALETLHCQMDILCERRKSSLSIHINELSEVQTWFRESKDGSIDLHQKAQTVEHRMRICCGIIVHAMTHPGICEREVEVVMKAILSAIYRLISIEANEIGKQTALSVDGHRLPVAIVHGMLPEIQKMGFDLLDATVTRASTYSLRHATFISSLLKLASESTYIMARPRFHESIEVNIAALGASTVFKLGDPLIRYLIEYCRSTWKQEDESFNKAKSVSSPEISNNSGGGMSKGKKRKRHIDITALSETTEHYSCQSIEEKILNVQIISTSLRTLSTCVTIYGCLLPLNTRSAVRSVVLEAIKRQKYYTEYSEHLDKLTEAISSLLLSEVVSGDSNNSHGTNLAFAMNFWRKKHSNKFINWLNNTAASTGEALIHPKGPPLEVKLDFNTDLKSKIEIGMTLSTSNAKVDDKNNQQFVRGKMNWDEEANDVLMSVHGSDSGITMLEIRNEPVDSEAELKRQGNDNQEVVAKSANVINPNTDYFRLKSIEYTKDVIIGDHEENKIDNDNCLDGNSRESTATIESIAFESTPNKLEVSSEDEFPDIVDN